MRAAATLICPALTQPRAGLFLLPPRERGEHRTDGQIEELGLDCFSHHAD
jgi:hypothetical protein